MVEGQEAVGPLVVLPEAVGLEAQGFRVSWALQAPCRRWLVLAVHASASPLRGRHAYRRPPEARRLPP